jgi:RNA polymerase sigma-70 factor (ECF subfamily)
MAGKTKSEVDETTNFAALLRGLRDGDPLAAEVLYRRYGPVLKAAVRRRLHPRLRSHFDTLDFVHDVWASFLAIPEGRYRFGSDSDLAGFLRQVAYNKVIEILRKRFDSKKSNVDRELPIDAMPASVRKQLHSPSATPSQWAIADEELKRLLSRFSAGHRAIVLRLREGYSIRDIARMSNVSETTVARVVRRLKDLMGA